MDSNTAETIRAELREMDQIAGIEDVAIDGLWQDQVATTVGTPSLKIVAKLDELRARGLNARFRTHPNPWFGSQLVAS